MCLLLSVLAAAPVPVPTREVAVVYASPEAPTLTKASTALTSIPTTTAAGYSASVSVGASLRAREAALDVTPIPTTMRLPILEYHYSTCPAIILTPGSTLTRPSSAWAGRRLRR